MVQGAATSRRTRHLVVLVVVAFGAMACSSASTGSKPTTTVNRSGSTTRPKSGANPGIVGAPFSNGSPTTAAGQPGAPATTAPVAGGPGSGTAPGSTAPPPPPQGLTKVGDACSPAGASAYTDTGRVLLCATDANGQLRWRTVRG